jgi:hypothetical protein
MPQAQLWGFKRRACRVHASARREVERLRRAKHAGGFALISVVAPIFDGEKEAKLIALACSKPPKGRARWTLRLLENKVVELGIVDRASDSTIHRTLKKTVSSRIAGSAG